MEKLGAYRLREKLGEGSYGEVYRADDPKEKRPVALKIFHADIFNNTEFIQNIPLEVKIARQLDHLNIVPIYDFDADKGRTFLVMKYMPGGSLKNVLETKGRLPLQLALQISRDIASALDYAHAKGVIHLDVKPGNILFDARGDACLSDFGLARSMHGSLGSLRTKHSLVGTFSYTAPELSEGGKITPACDIYSLACVFYEMLTGKILFMGEHPAEIIKKHGDRSRLGENWLQDIPSALQPALRQTLEVDPQTRFASAGDFAQALYDKARGLALLIDKQPTRPVPRSPQPTPESPARATKTLAKPWVLVFAGLIALLALGGIFIAGMQIGRGRDRDSSSTALAGVASFTHTPVNKEIVTTTLTPAATPTVTPTVDPNNPPPNPQPGDTWTSPIDGMVLSYIPAGTFIMGAADSIQNTFPDEVPAHEVDLDAYWMDQTEVTNGMYARCVEAGACQPPKNLYGKSLAHSSYYGAEKYLDYPVIYVNWDQAQAYCQWVDRRLPTEAEWEKGARGADGRLFPWGEEVGCKYANYWEYEREDTGYIPKIRVKGGSCSNDTAPVRSYPLGVSPYGLWEMFGNVAEWVVDWYSNSNYPDSPVKNPAGPETGDKKTIRGYWGYAQQLEGSSGSGSGDTGSFHMDPAYWWFNNEGTSSGGGQSIIELKFTFALRITYKTGLAPTLSSYVLGFRCAR